MNNNLIINYYRPSSQGNKIKTFFPACSIAFDYVAIHFKQMFNIVIEISTMS